MPTLRGAIIRLRAKLMRRRSREQQRRKPDIAIGGNPSVAAPMVIRDANAPRTWPGRDWMISSLLFTLLLLAYYPALRGTPVWDDDAHLTRPDLCSWAGLCRIWFDLTATQQYYPVTHSVFWLEHWIWGSWFPGYHLVNILLHAVSALLLARILRRLGIRGAWFGAVLWALHPIQVESVAWMS